MSGLVAGLHCVRTEAQAWDLRVLSVWGHRGVGRPLTQSLPQSSQPLLPAAGFLVSGSPGLSAVMGAEAGRTGLAPPRRLPAAGGRGP